MKILVVDGQGGRMGQAIIEELKKNKLGSEIRAVGTNSAASIAMLAAKPDFAATGENALLVNCRDADYIIGPMGIIIADALHGEISPVMAIAIAQSRAKKILLPVSRCNTYIVGVAETALSDMVKAAAEMVGK